ncbi:hypothetical protein TSMEX_009789 [Taenia solium]|eukprot:TsM_001153900 transcript=TsM_001153900 gene=TsM_001153900
MCRNSQPSNNWRGRREEEEKKDPTTLAAALADLPHFKEVVYFEDWAKTVRFNIKLYPQRQRVPLILCALLQELFLEAINARVTADSNIKHCCETMAQLAID